MNIYPNLFGKMSIKHLIILPDWLVLAFKNGATEIVFGHDLKVNSDIEQFHYTHVELVYLESCGLYLYISDDNQYYFHHDWVMENP